MFKKVATLHAKNAFSFAIIVGNLFADPVNASSQDEEDIAALLSGQIEVPLTTYFALGDKPLPSKVIEKLESSNDEACSNLLFLGKRTVIKTSDGIRIVALGGVLDTNILGASKDKYPPFYSEEDAKVLRGANSADILITSDWPSDVKSGSKVLAAIDEASKLSEVRCIADLDANLKPKYHFSVSEDKFYEREPFFHPGTEEFSDAYNITRFISLAKYGNATKQKWIYAFSYDPKAALPATIPPGTTASPLSFIGKKRAAPVNEGPSYRFSSDGHRGRHNNSRKKHKSAAPTPAECFFCLSNPNVATHLITSIGEEAYLTTAKGPLTTSNTFPKLGFPSHILIIPMTHAPTLSLIPDDDTRAQTYAEMRNYRDALHSMLRKKAGDELGSVTWEISRATGVHIHWQFMPVSSDLVKRGLVEAAFKVQAENDKYPAPYEKDVKDGSDVGDFFRVMIWKPSGVDGKGSEKTLVLPLDDSFRFGLQFGRQVMAKLLGLEKRLQWQDCGQSEQEETRDAEAFKTAFKEFDFSLEG